MEGLAADRHILDWDETDVNNWLSSLGYPQYESQIREHKIQGDSLCDLEPEGLKSLGITSIGQRISILKYIYQVKLAHDVPIGAHQYVPPSEGPKLAENINLQILSIVEEQAQRLMVLEEDNWNLNNALQSFMEQSDEGSPLILRKPSFKRVQPVKPTALESPYSSPLELIPNHSQKTGSSPLPSVPNAENLWVTPPPNGVATSSPKPTRRKSSENVKSFKITLEDPTRKVLPAALKKYHIKNEDWQKYALLICYGPSGNRVERCLSYDEKPLPLFQKLENAKKDPVFALKHIKDIRSPIPDAGATSTP